MKEAEFTLQVIRLGKIKLTYHPQTLIASWVIMGGIFVLLFLLSRRIQFLPTRRQVLLEALLGWFDEVLKETMGQRGRKFLFFMTTLFLFVLASNWAGIIPGVLSPTRDINVCLGFGLVVLITAHANSILTKGLKGYIKGYFEPFWWLFPSNVFSEIGKTLSHSFRLFGNIFAGGIIVAVIPMIVLKLFKFWGVPAIIIATPLLKGFFGLFLGGIQAFVFVVLAIAYISVLAAQ